MYCTFKKKGSKKIISEAQCPKELEEFHELKGASLYPRPFSFYLRLKAKKGGFKANCVAVTASTYVLIFEATSIVVKEGLNEEKNFKYPRLLVFQDFLRDFLSLCELKNEEWTCLLRGRHHLRNPKGRSHSQMVDLSGTIDQAIPSDSEPSIPSKTN